MSKSPLKSYREIQRLWGEGKGVNYLAKRFNFTAKKILYIVQSPPCVVCQDYHDCAYNEGKEWYSYGEVRFCPFQCIWLIEYRELIMDGVWPHDAANTDPMIHTSFASEAYFTKPGEIWAVFSPRLKKAGRSGQTLVEEIDTFTIKLNEKSVSLTFLSTTAYQALMYLKGARGKKVSFSQWLSLIHI